MTKIDMRALREEHAAAKRRGPERLREAHQRGLQAVKNGEMTYREAVAMKLHGTPPGPLPPHLFSDAYRRDDPLFGFDAVMQRGHGPYWEPDPDSTFSWR